MSNVLRLAIVDPDDASRSMLKATLLGMETIWLEADCSRYEFFADVVAQTSPDIGIVSLDTDINKALELVGNLSANAPECSILVVSSSEDGAVILQAMRAGAKEYLSKPVQLDDLLGALNRIRSRRFGKEEGEKTVGSQVVAITGGIGGVGVTTIAVNMACHWAQQEAMSVALLDLDLCLGDADILLDSIPDYTLVDVAQNVSRLDFSLLKRSLTKHSSGLYLLPRPMQMEDVAIITPENLARVIGLMKATFSHLVLDLSKSYNAIDLGALRMADTILLVTQLDLACLRNTVRILAWFDEMEGLGDRVKVVVNRMGHHPNHITVKKAQETIGREVFWELPNDYRSVEDARSGGKPLYEGAPRAAITTGIAAMGDALIGREASAAGESGAGLKLGRLFNTLLSGKGKQE